MLFLNKQFFVSANFLRHFLIICAQLYIAELMMIFLFFRMKQIAVFCASYAVILKLQKNIKLSENIIINLLTLSLKKMICIKQKAHQSADKKSKKYKTLI